MAELCARARGPPPGAAPGTPGHTRAGSGIVPGQCGAVLGWTWYRDCPGHPQIELQIEAGSNISVANSTGPKKQTLNAIIGKNIDFGRIAMLCWHKASSTGPL